MARFFEIRGTNHGSIPATCLVRTTCASCADGFRIVREVAQQEQLASFRGEELITGCECISDADVDAHIRMTATTVQHACCTCRVGRDESAVVDAQLRVRGVERLRVVDASVMPEIISCNIHAVVLAIAEWASDVIKGRAPLPAENTRAGRPLGVAHPPAGTASPGDLGRGTDAGMGQARAGDPAWRRRVVPARRQALAWRRPDHGDDPPARDRHAPDGKDVTWMEKVSDEQYNAR